MRTPDIMQLLSIIVRFLLFKGITGHPLKSRQATYTRLVVFGDSFSDDGNGAWIASNETWPADPAYYGHHFSNGPVWNQDLAHRLNVNLLNYAAGGATTDNEFVAGFTGYNSTIPVPSVTEQIATFLANDTVESSDVFAIYIGANDILFNTSIGGSQVVSLIEGQVHRLYLAGAQTILLSNYPRLDLLPAVYALDDATKTTVDKYGRNLSQGLVAIANGWRPYMNIAVAQIAQVVNEIVSNPTAYNINPKYLNPPTACLVGAYPGEGPRTLCDDPARHLFFDTYHPVYQVHKLVADAFEEQVDSFGR